MLRVFPGWVFWVGELCSDLGVVVGLGGFAGWLGWWLW